MSRDGEYHRWLAAQIDRRELLKRGGGVGLSLGAVGVLISACGGDDDETSSAAKGKPVHGGVLVFSREYDIEGLNPIGPSDNGSLWTIQQIFDQLVAVQPKGYDPGPGLAESWTASDDGLSYEFKLRKAKFSNGDPVTVDDVKYSIDRFRNPKINAAYGVLGAAIGEVVIVDPTTVRINLKRIDGAIIPNLAEVAAAIVPQKVVEDIGDKKFAEHPVGSGPFMLESRKRGQEIKLVRNPHYWRPGRPYLDGVTFRVVEDDNTRVLGLQSGQDAVAESVPFAQLDQLENGDGTGVLYEPLITLDLIALNNRKKPLDEKAVRQALNYATPKESILKSIYLGKGEIANSTLPKSKYWDKDIEPYAYDIEKAKSVLATSSVPDGFEISMIIVAGDSVKKQVAAVLKQEWAKIGVTLNISELDRGTMGDRFSSGDYQIAAQPVNNLTSDVTAPDELAVLLLDINGGIDSFWTYYDSKEASRLISEASASADEGKRQELFRELQRITLDDAPWIPMYFTTARTGIRKHVQGFKTVPTGWWNLYETWLSD